MSSVTDRFSFTDKIGDTLFVTDHENGSGISLSTSHNAVTSAVVVMDKHETIKLRDWLNKRYPR